MAKNKTKQFDYDLFFQGVICVCFEKSLPVLLWPSDERLVTKILFSGTWRQKQNLVVTVRVRSCMFLYICSIYVAITHLATILQENGTDI